MRATTRTRVTALLLAGGIALSGVACDDAEELADETAQSLPDVDADAEADADDGDVPTAAVLSVGDQNTDGVIVRVFEVSLDGGPGFVTIRADVDGAPGPVLGHTAVPEGDNLDVEIVLDQPIEGDLDLWAVVHVDADGDRALDFPDGNDVPLSLEGEVIQEPFTATRL